KPCASEPRRGCPAQKLSRPRAFPELRCSRWRSYGRRAFRSHCRNTVAHVEKRLSGAFRKRNESLPYRRYGEDLERTVGEVFTGCRTVSERARCTCHAQYAGNGL